MSQFFQNFKKQNASYSPLNLITKDAKVPVPRQLFDETPDMKKEINDMDLEVAGLHIHTPLKSDVSVHSVDSRNSLPSPLFAENLIKSVEESTYSEKSSENKLDERMEECPQRTEKKHNSLIQ